LATPTPTPTPRPGLVPGEAAKLLCDFFGSKPDMDQDGQGRNSGQKQARPTGPADFDPKNLRGDYCRILNQVKYLPASDFKTEYMIATVPDPINSRLDHQFDRYLDAIQQAIAAAGYTFDPHSLPWNISKPTAPVFLLAEPKTPQPPPRHLYEPGVILFRGNKILLLLFLVGETPTGGIHRVAFQNALWQIGELDGWKRSGTTHETEETAKKTLRIVGPSFSGSAYSLESLLRSWIGEYKS